MPPLPAVQPQQQATRIDQGKDVIWMSTWQFEQLRMANDPYGIYQSRKLLAKILSDIIIYRGHEWWHRG